MLRLARENPLWVTSASEVSCSNSASVSPTSVRNLLRRHRVPPAPRRAGLTWRRFLLAHGRPILACDYFTVNTVFLKRLYVLREKPAESAEEQAVGRLEAGPMDLAFEDAELVAEGENLDLKTGCGCGLPPAGEPHPCRPRRPRLCVGAR